MADKKKTSEAKKKTPPSSKRQPLKTYTGQDGSQNYIRPGSRWDRAGYTGVSRVARRAEVKAGKPKLEAPREAGRARAEVFIGKTREAAKRRYAPARKEK